MNLLGFTERLSNDTEVVFVSDKVFDCEDFKYRIYLLSQDFSFIDKNEKIYNKAVAAKVFNEQPKELINYVADGLSLDSDKVTEYDMLDFGFYGELELDPTPYNSFEDSINGLNKLISQIDVFESMFGFYMDKRANALGMTWREQLNGKLVLDS